MKYCQNFGNAMLNEETVCSQCGISQVPVAETVTADEDEGSKIGYGILGFFIPVVGLILYILWKKEKPSTAKAVGRGALVSFVLGIIFYIVVMVCSILFIDSEFSEMEDYMYEDYLVEEVCMR
ncbi:MAG: zinc ribbon domain-containing protein [Clostridia bacterium]|nr:zinc ribbon domain-containing protein [Clostridia bacterium]